MKKISISLFLFLTAFTISINAQSFSFAAMCDARGSYGGVNEPVLSALVNHLVTNNKDVKFLLFPGDMINGHKTDTNNTIKQYKKWKEVMSPVYNNPNMVWPYIWPMAGNHELQNRADERIFRREFPDVFNNGPDDEKGLTYSFDYNSVHFVAINTNRWDFGNPNDTSDDKRDNHYVKNLNWLEKDIKAALAKGAKYIFVMGHEQPFPIGGHLRDGLPNLGPNLKMPLDSVRKQFLAKRERFWKILSENKVSAYICGHEHLYGRQSINGVYQILTGSAGAPVYYFNSLYGDNPEEKRDGQEMTYNEALPYYKVLGYNHGKKGNCQASKDFVGYRAFEYVTFKVTPDFVEVNTYGGKPKENSTTELGTEISLIDSFVIKKSIK